MLDENISDLPTLSHYLIEHGRIGFNLKHLWQALDSLGGTTRYFTFASPNTVVATETSQRRVQSVVDVALMGRRWHMFQVTPYSLHDRGLTREVAPSLYHFLRHTGIQVDGQWAPIVAREKIGAQVKNLD